MTPNLLIPTSVLFQLYWMGPARRVPVPGLQLFRVLVAKASICSPWCCCSLMLENLWSRHTGVQRESVSLWRSTWQHPWGAERVLLLAMPHLRPVMGLGRLALAFLRMCQEERKSQKGGLLHRGRKHELWSCMFQSQLHHEHGTSSQTPCLGFLICRSEIVIQHITEGRYEDYTRMFGYIWCIPAAPHRGLLSVPPESEVG